MSNYTKNTWTDRIVEYPLRYKDELNNQKTWTPDPGIITEEGTYITAAKMNALENAIEKITNVYAASSAGSDSYAITITNSAYNLDIGHIVRFQADVSNAGTATININGLGVKTIKKFTTSGISDLVSNDIIANGIYDIAYDGTYFILLNPTNIVDILTTRGDLIIRDQNGYSRLGLGDSKKIIKSDGTDVIWDYENLTFIAETILSDDNQTYVDFTSIPNTYRHLKLYCIAATTHTVNRPLAIQINSDTGNNYWSTTDGVTATSKTASATVGNIGITGSNNPSRIMSHCVVDFPFYTSTNSYKTWSSNNAYGYYSTGSTRDEFLGYGYHCANESVTTAISTIRLIVSGGYYFKTGSKFALYGVR